MWGLLGTYFRSPVFLLLLVLSFGLTALREAFGFWVPTYLVEAAHFSESAASRYSALYSAFGMVSILGAGYLSDTWLHGRRGPLLLGACLGLVPVLGRMAQPPSGTLLPLVLVSLVGLLLLGALFLSGQGHGPRHRRAAGRGLGSGPH